MKKSVAEGVYRVKEGGGGLVCDARKPFQNAHKKKGKGEGRIENQDETCIYVCFWGVNLNQTRGEFQLIRNLYTPHLISIS